MSSGAGHMIRYAIYTRQSVDKAEDFSSCDVQFMTCQEFARAMGEPGLHWTGQRFDDEGCSGATLDRPAMRRLRKVIDLGGIDRLYAVALDRLTRNMRDAVILFDELDKAGVELRLVHQPELSSGPETRFLRHILAAFAEFERDMIAARIAESRAYLKGHGRRLAGKVPYGYDADPVTRQLVPNAVEARRVRAIFARAARLNLVPTYTPTGLVLMAAQGGSGEWQVDADGNASLPANWSQGVPNGVGDVAAFGSAITAPHQVTVDAPTTLGGMQFTSLVPYTVAGPEVLTFDVEADAATITATDVQGSHVISTDVDPRR